MADERRVELQGAVNVRDLGGYRTGDGSIVRWGRVYRADALGPMTADDLARFGELGCRTVLDLRGAAERDELPDPVPSRHVEVGPGLPSHLVASPASLRTAEDGERWLFDEYVWRLDHAAPAIGAVFAALAADDALPALFHCAGGKDRTGIVAALLLRWLGVERAAVLDDYQLSARYRTLDREGPLLAALLATGIAAEAAEAFLGAPRWVLAGALDHVDERHGGVAAYLRGPAGVPDEALDALRRRLLIAAGQRV